MQEKGIEADRVSRGVRLFPAGRSTGKRPARAGAVWGNKSVLTHRIVSPARSSAGAGPNFILSMTMLCTLGVGAAATSRGTVALASAQAIARIIAGSRPDARHASGAGCTASEIDRASWRARVCQYV